MIEAAPISYPAHGGNLAWAAARFPAAPRPWLDLSTGINPWPYKILPEDGADLHRLPDAAMEAALCAAIAARLGLDDAARIVLAPGSESLIRLLPRLLPSGPVAILAPSYGGHAEAWALAGHAILPSANPLQVAAPVRVLVSPNNPDGRVFDIGVAPPDSLLVLDRAFAPFAAAPPGECIALYSFGKFFGLPGLRLGFAVAPVPWAARLRAGLGAWPVNALALRVACRAYADTAWIAATTQQLAVARQRLDALLAAHGWVVAGGTDLFRLLRDARAPALFRHLAAAGILTRVFDYDATLLRLGLPGAEAEWQRLHMALEAWHG